MPSSYLLLLLSWTFLLPVVFRSYRRGDGAFPLLPVFAINLFFMLYEGYMTFVWSKTVVAPIRVDIFGVILILVVINTLTSLWLWLVRPIGMAAPRRIEKAAALMLFAVSMNASIDLARVFRAGSKASETAAARRRLEFQTKFRDATTIRRYFGDLGTESKGWAGHYVAEPKAGVWLTRLVINTDGHVWAFFKCEADAECTYVDGSDTALQAPSQSIRITGLKAPVGVETASLDLEKQTDDRVAASLIVDVASARLPNAAKRPAADVTFVRAPPPVFGGNDSVHDAVEYLGVFSNGHLDGHTLFVVQVWLWRSDRQLFGEYLRRGWALGSRADFVSAERLSGTFDPTGARVAFKVNDQESFQGVLLDGGEIDGEVLWLGRPLQAVRLKRKEMIPGFPYDLAPRTDVTTTQEWLRVASSGTMISWQVPALFDPSTW